MRSAADFLPLCMTTFMNLASMSLWNFGSGKMTRIGAWARRDIVTSYGLKPGFSRRARPMRARRTYRWGLVASLLRPLGAVLGTALLSLVNTGAIERAAHRVVTHARQILDAAPADQHHRVLLQIVAFAADVARHLVAVGQAHAAHLAQRGIRLLRRGGVHARAHTALLRRSGQRRNLGLPGRLIAAGTNQLGRRRHKYLLRARAESRPVC